MKSFKIAHRWIGADRPAFIVAEIGSNHQGSVNVALRMIDAAAQCRVDAVKFQVKCVEEAFDRSLLDRPYVGPHSFGKTYREHKEALELSHSDLKLLRDHAASLDLIWFATPFDLTSMRFLRSMGVPAIKISSFHLTDVELVRAAGKMSIPVILSTGMSTMHEIDLAVMIMRTEAPTAPFALLQCTSSYPTEDRDVNLAVIKTLRDKFRCVVGYSSHDRGVSIPAASVCFGAKIIEKHFTLDRTSKGTDHAMSLEPKGMRALVDRLRLIEAAIGSSEKVVLGCEKAARKKNRWKERK